MENVNLSRQACAVLEDVLLVLQVLFRGSPVNNTFLKSVFAPRRLQVSKTSTRENSITIKMWSPGIRIAAYADLDNPDSRPRLELLGIDAKSPDKWMAGYKSFAIDGRAVLDAEFPMEYGTAPDELIRARERRDKTIAGALRELAR